MVNGRNAGTKVYPSIRKYDLSVGWTAGRIFLESWATRRTSRLGILPDRGEIRSRERHDLSINRGGIAKKSEKCMWRDSHVAIFPRAPREALFPASVLCFPAIELFHLHPVPPIHPLLAGLAQFYLRRSLFFESLSRLPFLWKSLANLKFPKESLWPNPERVYRLRVN